MVNTDGQIGMRANEDTFTNMPLASAPRPHVHDEYPTAWTFEKIPITEEEARGCMNVFTSLTRNDWVLEQRRRKGMHGTTLCGWNAHDPSGHRQQHQHQWSGNGTDV
eukprot:2926219-Pyramimonas_sp.AAC.1